MTTSERAFDYPGEPRPAPMAQDPECMEAQHCCQGVASGHRLGKIDRAGEHDVAGLYPLGDRRADDAAIGSSPHRRRILDPKAATFHLLCERLFAPDEP